MSILSTRYLLTAEILMGGRSFNKLLDKVYPDFPKEIVNGNGKSLEIHLERHCGSENNLETPDQNIPEFYKLRRSKRTGQPSAYLEDYGA